ncbi:MAG TPA: amidohydrolase family protein [Flavobacteriales bacterium]|nr:amidohydrolase family protein [Flavobacteriales bacterium]
MHRILLTLLSIAVSVPVFAQKKSAGKTETKTEWNVNTPPGPAKSVSFDLTEGTWMNLDVSPDGKTLVFDLLGDIYSMPSSGGAAVCLRSGYAYEVQPRFSPDGSRISFTSDAGGADNIWVMNADGSNPKQITKEDFRLLNNAVWTRDGNYLIARKHFTSTRSAGAGELWMYHISGGSGMQLTTKKNDQQDLGEPFVSNDDRYVYYSEDVYPGGYFQYNKDPNSQIYVIKRLDRITGSNDIVVRGPGGAVRPTLSHDGKHLAFVRRVREKTVLFVRDLASGIESPIYSDLSKDQQEAWAIFGVYTNFNWSPNDQFIYIWAKGHIQKIGVKSGEVAQVPFKLTSNHKITDALHFQQQAAPDSFDVKTIRQAILSPDGKYIVFNAVGYLWMKDLPAGKPRRLTNTSHFEFEPAFSSNGEKLAWVTWSDTAMGAIIEMDLKTGALQKLNKEKGIYRTPNYSPDGKQLVYQKEEGNDHQGFAWCNEPGIYLMNAQNGSSKRILTDGESPRFSADGQRIFYQTGGYLFGSLEKAFRSVDLTGNDERTHYKSTYANQYIPSPDNKWLAFTELFKVYLTPLISTGKALDLSNGTTAYPVKLVSQEAGINLHWNKQSSSLNWTLGDQYYSTDVKPWIDLKEGATAPKPVSKGLSIGLRLAHQKPSEKVAYTHARIVTMKDSLVIEDGTIITEGNRITQMGKSADIQPASDVKIVECDGKTIIPGLIDVHAHLGTFRYGLSPQQQWSYFANLAFGVTTTHDPSSNTEMVFSQSEMVKAGTMTGPRIFSTGIILYGADGDFRAQINNLEDAQFALKRTKAFGAFSVKSYNQPRRNQRQQVITGARELGMEVVPEGGSHFFHNMSMILDGHTGIEHNIPVADIYDDVVKLWSNSKTGYTPTLIVSYGAVNGEYYFYEKDKVWENARLLNFTPRALIDSRARYRTAVPDEEYDNGHIQVARSCKKLADAGVKVNLGAHGQIQGVGAHWELKMLASGGMSNYQALKCATVNGAYYIGMEKDLGTLEVGKLADFVVLDSNPLDDINNIGSIRYTVANGNAFDAMTMQSIHNMQARRLPFYFENMYGNNDFKWHDETHGFHNHMCGCRK